MLCLRVVVHSLPTFRQLNLLIASNFVVESILERDGSYGVTFALTRHFRLLLRGTGGRAVCLSVSLLRRQEMVLRTRVVSIAIDGFL